MKNRKDTDWEKELKPEEIITGNDGLRVVILKALQRLAREAGIVESYPQFLGHAVAPDGRGLVQCIYITRWPDGTTFGGAADVNSQNINPEFIMYPTAIAESRAEIRALRKALGITILGAEEIDMTEGFTGVTRTDSGKIDSQQAAAIERLLEDTKVEPIDLFKAIAKDRDVLDINDLTAEEAVKAMGYLNGQRGKKSNTRADRKASLEAALEGETA